jgi:hypothetical protein
MIMVLCDDTGEVVSKSSDYWNTQHWRDFKREYRLKKFKDGVEHCEDCGKRDGSYSIHHKTYARIGRERLSDVVCLCWKCHRKVHSGENHVSQLANNSKPVYAARMMTAVKMACYGACNYGKF